MTTFGALFVPEPIREAVSDAAWLGSLLEVELALAKAEARAGVVSADAAAAVADACVSEDFDIESLCEQGRAAGNPVEPLVRALRDRVGGDAARWVHYGATNQDALDSAAMLVARNALGLIDKELEGAARACARLADEHRATEMAARTLLQHAVPTTFGLKAAGWLVALLDARDRLGRLTLPAQLGGAAGTLGALGDDGVAVLGLFAEELELAEPALARACARGVRAQVSALAADDHEHERAAGAWHAEWNALTEALALAGGAAAAIRECLSGLQVDAGRMRANMSDALYSERDAFGLQGDYLGSAHAFVQRALERWGA